MSRCTFCGAIITQGTKCIACHDYHYAGHGTYNTTQSELDQMMKNVKSDRVIYKYKVPASSKYSLFLPKGSRPLHIGYMHGDMYVWVELTMSEEKENIDLYIVATGESFQVLGAFLGTVLMQDQGLVWHVYWHNSHG